MGIFKANDIRGVFPEELSPEICYRIGFSLPEVLDCSKILVGRDARLSSIHVFSSLTEGIMDAGADVVDIGVCDTPAVYFATAQYNFPGSVMITASHNPPEYNGLKISLRNAVPLGFGTGLEKLQMRVESVPSVSGPRGIIETLEIEDAYVKHVLKFSGDLSGLSVVFDASNGGAGVYLDSIFSKTQLHYDSLNTEPDGNFPGHGPNPLESGSWEGISRKISVEKMHAGVLFDGDGDRAVFFDENGDFISPDIITALIGVHLLSPESDRMFFDVRSSRSVAEYIRAIGGTAAACGSGHAKIKKLLRDSDGVYAGELSGHYYFRDNYYCDSGFIAAVVMLTVLNELNRPFSEIVREVNPYFFSGELNFRVENIGKVISNLEKSYSSGTVSKMDGLRVDFDSWWFIVRSSSAEPVLRLVVEADTEKMMREKVTELSEFIEKSKTDTED